MLNKSNKVFETAGYLLTMGAILYCLAGCNPSENESSRDPGTGPPPPPVCDFEEVEPNNFSETANFVTSLPSFGENEVCGSLVPQDFDTFYFFLSPDAGDDEIIFNFSVETAPQVIPRVTLRRTVYDAQGNPTGGYEVLGVFYGDPGALVVLDFALEVEDLVHNDLLLELTAAFPYPDGVHAYEILYWSY